MLPQVEVQVEVELEPAVELQVVELQPYLVAVQLPEVGLLVVEALVQEVVVL